MAKTGVKDVRKGVKKSFKQIEIVDEDNDTEEEEYVLRKNYREDDDDDDQEGDDDQSGTDKEENLNRIMSNPPEDSKLSRKRIIKKYRGIYQKNEDSKLKPIRKKSRGIYLRQEAKVTKGNPGADGKIAPAVATSTFFLFSFPRIFPIFLLFF